MSFFKKNNNIWWLLLPSFVILAFGQPAYSSWLGIFASSIGFALFWLPILSLERRKSKFWAGTLFFSAVQLVQLVWFISHPYAYIYPVYLLLSFGLGLQFGWVTSYIDRKRLSSYSTLIGVTALWTLLEWSRLFVFSGFSWNPVGLYLTTTLYGLQSASLVGVFGISFWVILTNLFALRVLALQKARVKNISCWLILALLPYCYGAWHYHTQLESKERYDLEHTPLNALLVQTAFPVEEAMGIESQAEFIALVLDEWKQILTITNKEPLKPLDLVVLPEFVVPLGTYTFIYPYEVVKNIFEETYGSTSIQDFPPKTLPFAKEILTSSGNVTFVNNAFFAQAIANHFQAPIVLGLEDVEESETGERTYFSAAFVIEAQSEGSKKKSWPFVAERYEKRVLVPMGEYIPFSFLQELAKSYGVMGSFTCGCEGKVLNCHRIPLGISICYEETFGDMMLESRQKGAELLVNVTSDVWYPDSSLTKQHFDHARLRAVEAGIPLIRSCNTGITCAVDSLGQQVASLEEYDEQGNWLADSLFVTVSKFHYNTFYMKWGDKPVIAGSFFALFLFFYRNRFRKK